MGPRAQGGKSVSGAVALWMRMGEKDEARKAEKPAHTAQLKAIEQKLGDLGVDEEAQATLGDQKVEAIRAQLKDQGVDVADEPLAEVGPAGEDLGLVADRVQATDDVLSGASSTNGAPSDKLESGPVKASPSPKNILLGRQVKGCSSSQH